MTRHVATRGFWQSYAKLPAPIQRLADQNFALLKADPRHPSLRFKKAGPYWSVRVGLQHRALGVDCEAGIAWFWIGSHADYDRLIRS